MVWIVLWWIFEVIDISVIVLFLIVFFLLLGVMEFSLIIVLYGYKYIFFYMGGFILVIIIEKWNLYKRIVLFIINVIGMGIFSIIFGFMIVIVFMFMWIFNIVIFVMMFLIGLVIIF